MPQSMPLKWHLFVLFLPMMTMMMHPTLEKIVSKAEEKKKTTNKNKKFKW